MLTPVLESEHRCQHASPVGAKRYISDRFSPESVVWLGCVLDPALFNQAINWIIGLVATRTSTMLMITRCQFPPCNSSAALSTASKTMSLDVSRTKAKVQTLGSDPPVINISAVMHNVEGVTYFSYMGCVVDSLWHMRIQTRYSLLRKIGMLPPLL